MINPSNPNVKGNSGPAEHDGRPHADHQKEVTKAETGSSKAGKAPKGGDCE